MVPAFSRLNSDISSSGRAARNSVSSGSSGNGNKGTGLESPYEVRLYCTFCCFMEKGKVAGVDNG